MPVDRNSGQFGKPTYNQAFKIARKFGGEANLARLIGVARISVYRWQYRRPYGSDGLIPAFQIEKIRAVARVEGILLRPEDWSPERNKWTEDGTSTKRRRTSRHAHVAQPAPSTPTVPTPPAQPPASEELTLADLLG